MEISAPRVLFAAAASGSGKTTLTCAVIRALQNRGIAPRAFKCGPDFIDPMFHRRVLRAPSSNLDLFLMGEAACTRLLAEKSNGAGISLLEGVMGYYDGIGQTDAASSYALARATKTPVVLVTRARGASVTLAAVLRGLAAFRADSNIVGVILNGVTRGMYPFYRSIVEEQAGLRALGYMPDLPDCAFESRHLGLVMADEIGGIGDMLSRLAAQAEQSVDLAGLMEIASSAPPLSFEKETTNAPVRARIAVARDPAFCFYYDDSLSVLENLGAQIVPFSPLADTRLPDCDGMILGGGYPELHAQALSDNKPMLDAVRTALAAGTPCIAECGGFMYLHETLRTKDGRAFPMAGAVPGEAFMTARLSRFGYVTLTARADNLLCRAGERLPAHEFHYSDSTAPGAGFSAQKPGSDRRYDCIVSTPTLFAGYPHIHFAGAPHFAENFLKNCEKHRRAVSSCSSGE